MNVTNNEPVRLALNVALVIPAHNEADAIGETVMECLRGNRGIPLFVIADRCADRTAENAQTAGARVLVRREGVPGKGPAIAWFLEAATLELRKIDALVFIDADSRLRDGALEVLVQTLAARPGVVQAFVLPVPDETSPGAVLAAYSEWLAQALDDRIRLRLGWSVPLRGTGMALPLKLLLEVAPQIRTRVEDVELTLLLVRRGDRITFVPEAVIEDPKPATMAGLARQRARWLQGQGEIWRLYWRTVLSLMVTRGPEAWSLLSALLAKPRTLVIAAKVLVLVLISWLAADLLLLDVVRVLIWISLFVDIARYAFGLFLIPASWRRPILRSAVRSPIYALMWLRSLILSFTSREAWLRTRE